MKWFLGAWPKIATIVFVVAAFITQWRAGYFHGLSLKTICWKSFLKNNFIPLFFLAIGSVALDPFVLSLLQSVPPPLAASLADFGGAIGRHVHPWLFLAVLLLISICLKKALLRACVFGSLFSAFLASLYSFIFKFLFLRARPNTGLGHLSFFNFEGIFKDDRIFQSFPSGDVVVVAAISFYFFFQFKKNAIKWLLILLPLSTAFARVYANKHWPSDGIVAIAMGLIAARAVFQYEKLKNKTT